MEAGEECALNFGWDTHLCPTKHFVPGFEEGCATGNRRKWAVKMRSVKFDVSGYIVVVLSF